MLYLLNKNARTVRWNGEPLHEATSAIVKEALNGEFTLTVKYPISDTGIYQQIKEDMLIKCPTPILGPQLFRIKKPVENNDYLEITAYHITDDIMQRSIKPVSVDNQSCGMALSRMVQNAKTDLGEFSFNSDIQDRRTFNTTETTSLYSVLLDGKHSIVGAWEGELVRDNFSLTVKKSRGENHGVVITTHKNLKSYQRSKNSQNIITRIHAKSTYKPEGSEDETTIKVTVDSPLINSYPYINEKEYENNNAKTVEELKKWAQAKFTNEGIDKVSDAIKIEAYELDGQIVNLGDTVNIKSLKHDADLNKKSIAYEYDALKEEYISLTFDDKAEVGSSKSFGGLSNAAETILNATQSAQEIALDKALKNADLDFEYQSNKLKQEIQDGIELAKAKAEENKQALSDEINRRFHEFSPAGFEEAKTKAEEAFTKARAGYELADEVKYIADQNALLLDSLANKANDREDKLNNTISDLNDFKTNTIVEREKLSGELKRYSREETQSQITQRFQDFTRDNEAKLAEYKQGIDGRLTTLASQIAGNVTQADFQRVRETSQLYERILGTTEQGVADNASRLVMSSQIFQTEVGKYSTTGGPNLLRNSRADDGLKYWNGAPNEFHFREHEFYMNGQKRMFLLDSGALVYSQRFIFKRNTDYILNLLAFDANTARVRITLRKRKKDSANSDYDEVQTIFDKTGSPAFSSERALKRSFKFNTGDFDNGYLVFQYFGNPNGWSGMFMTELDFYEGSNDRKWQPAPEDSEEPIEAVKTKVTQLAGSWAVQNLTNAGSIASQINTNANNILIEANKIRLKGSTLADEITAIDGRFKRLFVGEGNFATLNTDVLRSNSISGDKLAVDQALIDKLVASDVFTNTLSAKNAFINRLRSTIVSATLLEGYKGKIGGFQIGTHEKDPNSYWFTGLNQFQVGMGSGNGKWGQTALWVNWGNNWNQPGDTAWYVKNNGEMYCYNQAHFWNTPIIHGNLKVSGNIYYITDDNTKQGGYWIHSPSFKRIQENAGYVYLYHFDDSYVWIPINKEISDRRFKTNIKDSQVSGLDVIENLKTYSYCKEYDEKIEDISCGIMAQDVQKYAPEAFYENPDGAYSYNTFALVPYLIKAIQELNKKVERLETT